MFHFYDHDIAYRKNMQHTAGLILVFALLCNIFYIPCYLYIENLNRSISLEHYENGLESGLKMLDTSIEAILSAETVLTNTGTSLSGFLSRKQIDDTKLLTTRRFLSAYFAPYDFVTNMGIVMDTEPLLDRYMLFYSLTPLEYQNHLDTPDETYWDSIASGSCTTPVTSFHSSVLGDYEAITISRQLSKRNNAYLFVHYSVNSLFSLFAREELLDVCRICVYCDSQLLVSNREELTESCQSLKITGEHSALPISVEMQIPDSYLSRDLRPLRRLVFVFLMVLILSCLVWVVLFTFIISRPINNLTRALFKTGHIDVDCENMSSSDFLVSAIQQLDSKITDYRQIVESQHQRSRTQLLERALYRGLYTEESRRAFQEAFPDFPGQWQLALVQYISQSENIEPDAIQVALSQYFEQISDQFFCLPFNKDAVIVLLPATSSAGEALQALCDQYEEQYPISLSYYLGNVYDDPVLLADAFQQIEYSSLCLQMNAPAPVKNSGGFINIHQLQTIYYALQNGDSKTATTILESNTTAFLASQDRVSAKYAYRALSYMLLQLKLENRDLNDIPIPAFKNDRFVPLFREDFPRCFDTICQRMAQERKELAQNLGKNILDYIDENYCNQWLSVTAVTDHFSISAPTLQKQMNACVGKTFSAYVEELRMKKARTALLDTTQSIQEISESIGYTNTNSFYKAYRRIFGESPRVTRQGREA